ncbi:3-dehydroquinate dehydratase [Philodulcilactobacillus myokoensis]|uniref:3-dehydroquinate dehydratase n=1 Tax=Philodulcilactobacillus myokoensis TaxID=2929573 RepID=A0A9W6B2N9_9LACO|nr:type I 3-dehydroquinate dehydratase [Philodulcilactobacillus myokoensis]GLB47493.1 3-dehydroquinate dehydratase [Philodulcilactobacillus myokoensis]
MKVKNLKIGSGKPKIAVPITGSTTDEILKQLNLILKQNDFDLIEWRIDFWKQFNDVNEFNYVAQMISEKLEAIPLLITFRSFNEGGQTKLTEEQYAKVIHNIINCRVADLIDIELMHPKKLILPLIHLAQNQNIKVIQSYHNFKITPEKSEMLEKLDQMQLNHVDIAKIAVMPHTSDDILNLLEVSNSFHHESNLPLISMSMGNLGKITRVSGQLFGSCITFGTVGNSSAPGQINCEILNQFLNTLN